MSGRINPGGHGWTKDVSPPSPGSRPKGLPEKPQEKIIFMEASQQGQQNESDVADSQPNQPVQDQSASQPRDQVAEEAQREQERAVQRQEHNDRTGGVPGGDSSHDGGLGAPQDLDYDQA